MLPKVCVLLALMAPVAARADAVVATWYGPGFGGNRAASGCVVPASTLTAASRTLALGTVLRVRRGNRAVEVVITSRRPHVAGRVLDLSRAAAERLGLSPSPPAIGHAGVSKVRIAVVGRRALHCW